MAGGFLTLSGCRLHMHNRHFLPSTRENHNFGRLTSFVCANAMPSVKSFQWKVTRSCAMSGEKKKVKSIASGQKVYIFTICRTMCCMKITDTHLLKVWYLSYIQFPTKLIFELENRGKVIYSVLNYFSGWKRVSSTFFKLFSVDQLSMSGAGSYATSTPVKGAFLKWDLGMERHLNDVWNWMWLRLFFTLPSTEITTKGNHFTAFQYFLFSLKPAGDEKCFPPVYRFTVSQMEYDFWRQVARPAELIEKSPPEVAAAHFSYHRSYWKYKNVGR